MATDPTRSALRRIDRLFDAGTSTGLDDDRLLERFAADHDESTLEALIERHGPMVLGVCRRMLANPADVDDAFQATFLILVRKAHALRDVHRLGPWLHAVACKVAARARSDAAKRKLREQTGARPERSPDSHAPDRLAAGQELRDLVDGEIARLSSAHRAAVILCDLEGRSQQDAARLLGWSEDALRGRLARARQKLRARLERQGLAPALIAGPSALPPIATPPALVAATTRAAMASVLAGRAAPTAGGAISASVAALTQGAVRTMIVARAGRAAAAFLFLALGLLAASGFVRAGLPRGDDDPAVTHPTERAQQPAIPSGVELRVLDRSDRKPIVGATIEATIWDSATWHESKQTTDADGRCRFRLPDGVQSYSFIIARDGYVPVSRTWNKDEGAPPTSLSVELEPGTPIGGLVRDEHGRPIAGADVTVAIGPGLGEVPDVDVPVPANFSTYAGYPRLQVKTDAEGRWRCSILPANPGPGTRLWFFVEHPDHVSDTGGYSRRLSIKTARAMTGALIMADGIDVRGQVRDGENRPVPDAGVVLAYSRSTGDSLKTTTDREGRFRFPHVGKRFSTNRWTVVVEAAGFGPAWEVITPTATVPSLDLHLTAARPFHGRVVDPKGRPIAGAAITAALPQGSHLGWSTTTEADGRFVWPDAPANGEILFGVRKAGYLLVTGRRIPTSSGQGEITLKPPMRVRGTVVDAETGQPIPSFRILDGQGFDRDHVAWNWRKPRTATDGRFDVSPFNYDLSGASAYLRIEADGYGPATSSPIQLGEPEITLDFRLKKANGISGFVRTPDGKPAAGADVYLTNPKYGLPLHNNRQEPPPAREFWTQTDAKGHFAFRPQDDTYGVLVVHSSGFGRKSPEDLARSSGITLERFGRIEGILRVGAGIGARQPIHMDLECGADPSDSWRFVQYDTETDAHGRFTIENVIPGEATIYRLSAPLPEGIRLNMMPIVDVVPGETSHVELGGRGRPVTGRITVPANAASRVNLAVAQGGLLASPPDEAFPKGFKTWDPPKQRAWSRSAEGKALRRTSHFYNFTINADGCYRIDDVLTGNYELTVNFTSPPDYAAPRPGGPGISARAERQITIAPIPGGRTDEPLDLGTLEMKVQP
ncbi:MAG: sigma-70 family RNA polymerase sigma factor [Isosphaeraceae bacterium]